MIDNIGGFIQEMFKIVEYSTPGSLTTGSLTTGSIANYNEHSKGNMYCPKCCSERKMQVSLLYPNPSSNNLLVSESDRYKLINEVKKKLIATLWIFKCLQCDTIFTVIFYEGSDGIQMAVLPSCNGGVVTQNTPPSVAYYLDQAYKAKSVSANSACIAMYRSALEQLLYEQGYTDEKLYVNIEKLSKQIKDGTAPVWAKDLNTNSMDYIRKLGNGAIHPNNGEYEKQKALDNELVEVVDIVFSKLLDRIYEEPHRFSEFDRILQERVKELKK